MDFEKHLIARNNKLFSDAEIVLLAKVISDRLPLPGNSTSNIKQHYITLKLQVREFIFYLSNYSYISPEQENHIHKLACDFLQWRYVIATGPTAPLFLAGSNYMIDELSLMPKYVNMSEVTALCSEYGNASFIYNLFNEVYTHVTTAK